MEEQQKPNSDSASNRTKGTALGAGVGIVVGAALSNPGIGMVLGAAIGLILGPSLVHKLK